MGRDLYPQNCQALYFKGTGEQMRQVPNRMNNLKDARSASGLLDLTTDTEYVANLVNINVYGRRRATVQFIAWVCYTRITILLI